MKPIVKYCFPLIIIYLLLSFIEPPNYRLIVFEGSDWCANCQRLEKNILTDSTFKAFLKNNSIYLEKIDFPQKKKLDKKQVIYNNSVAEKYNFDGSYPTILLTTSTSHTKIHYNNQSVKEITQQIGTKLVQIK